MNEISRQVNRAKQRIFIGYFFRLLSWGLFGGLLLAAVGVTLPKIWAISAAADSNWNLYWIVGGIVAGVVFSGVLAWINRSSQVAAALEVDKRFALKERLSSALALDEQTAGTPAGKALIEDAERRARKIDIRDRFSFKPTAKVLLPLIPAAIVALILFLPNAVSESRAASGEASAKDKKELRVRIEQSKKLLKEKVEKLQATGLKDAEMDFESLGKKIDELDADDKEMKKEALVKLNEIRKKIDEQKEIFGDADQMQAKFNQLKPIEQGPAKELNDALNQGDFEAAQQAIQNLADKLRDGRLSEVEKKQLGKNLNDMAEQIREMAERHEQQKEELKQRIDQAMRDGDLSEAARLQEQLDKRLDQDRQMQKMRDMAENLQRAADGMPQNQNRNQQQQGQQNQQQPGQQNQQQPGQQNQQQPGQQQPGQQQGQPQPGQQPGQQPTQQQMQQAQQALEDLGQQMERMQADMETMQALQDLEQGLQQCKDGLNGCDCQGQGQQGGASGQGRGKGNGRQDWAGGEGRGGGMRAKDSTGNTGHFRARVKGEVTQGKTIVTGNADGENVSGKSVAEARALIQSSLSEKNDPLENVNLPRASREHARQYFQNLRGD